MFLIKKELKYNFKNFFIWTMIFILFGFMYIPITNKLLENMGPLMDFVDKFPKFLLQTFNFNKEMFSKAEGIFGSEGMTFTYFLGAFFATFLSSNLYVKEFDSKTIEFLITKPVSRKFIFIQKFLSGIFYIIILNLIFTVNTLLLFNIFIKTEYSVKILLGFGLYSLTVQLFFYSLSTLIGIISQKSSVNTAVSTIILIFMYFGNTLGESFESIKFISYMSIFKYIPLIETVENNKIFFSNSIIIIFLSFIITFISYNVFKRSDFKI